MKTQLIARIQKFFGTALGVIAQRYIEKYQPRVIVIAGSIGKTATTQAIATVLKEQYKIRATYANYNTATGVPLSMFDERFPVTRLGWLTLIPRLWLKSREKQNFDVLVLELGTDHPGELQHFSYLKPELGIITAISPEHMEFFETIDAVAREEFTISTFCTNLLINRDMVSQAFLKKYAPSGALLVGEQTDYTVAAAVGNTITIRCGRLTLKNVSTQLVGTHSLYSSLIAAAVGQRLGMDEKRLRKGLQRLKPIPGRMQLLEGKKHAKIIDDTYNSSPEAAIAALNTLYAFPGKQRIALLGTMNELGRTAPLAHRNLGNHCDPEQLDLVITLGEAANNYTAKAARKRGCEVIEANTPYDAADAIFARLKSHAVILAKGSQNGVFAEEAVKQLLKHPKDSKQLVRQTPYWLAVKRIAFQDNNRSK
jgi:UDP-N-acetylmuramyl pentapeptide synthase